MRARHFFFVAIVLFSRTAIADVAPADWLKENLMPVAELYRELHRSPELSHFEEKTAAKMAAELKAIGAEVTTGIGGHGVVGILKSGTGPLLMLRADMDALPVTEATGLDYASKVRVKNPDDGQDVGVMHACGHDIHMASLIGAARFLAANKTKWKGTIMFLFQPAEERGTGARKMLEDKVFEKLGKPDYAVALHVDSSMAAGKVGVRAGYAMANVDSVDITIKGRGGHGAAPHTAIDPIVIAAHFIVQLQTIVAREINPTEPAVVTVGSIHGGSKHNIISDTCELKLTVRSYNEEVRDKMIAAIERKAKAAAMAAGAPEPVMKVSDEGTPALFNHEELTARVSQVLRGVVGKDNVENSPRTMGGEDFARYGKAGVPICMFRLGSVKAARLEQYKLTGGVPSLHSALYYPDIDETLTTGINTMSAVVMDLLKP